MKKCDLGIDSNLFSPLRQGCKYGAAALMDLRCHQRRPLMGRQTVAQLGRYVGQNPEFLLFGEDNKLTLMSFLLSSAADASAG
jgi:hypothetical protein